MSSVRAVRGATQVDENSSASIDAATRELVTQVMESNSLDPSEVISIIFTMSPDLDAAFPAASARSLGFELVPLICAVEIAVPGSLPRTIRLMAHVNTELKPNEIAHIYLHGARSLRSDIAQ